MVNNTLKSVYNIAGVYSRGLKNYEKAEELYQRALEGYEAQLGRDHEDSKSCAKNLAKCFFLAGDRLKLKKIISKYPHILIDGPALKEYL